MGEDYPCLMLFPYGADMAASLFCIGPTISPTTVPSPSPPPPGKSYFRLLLDAHLFTPYAPILQVFLPRWHFFLALLTEIFPLSVLFLLFLSISPFLVLLFVFFFFSLWPVSPLPPSHRGEGVFSSTPAV